MKERLQGPMTAAFVFFCFSLSSVRPVEATGNQSAFKTGLNMDYYSRTITWDNKTRKSKLSAALFTVREEIELRPGLSLNLLAGLSLSDYRDVLFMNLPLSLRYGAGFITGLALGAGLKVRLAKLGDFEIDGEGQFVSSLGFTKTWALEGFAVPGTAKGNPTWAEASAGPRLAYMFFSRFVPYLAVSGNWLWGRFRMDENLGDLTGSETKPIRGKSFIDIALGADFELSKHLNLKAQAGFFPHAGGVDSAVSIGILTIF